MDGSNLSRGQSIANVTTRELDEAELAWVSGGAPLWAYDGTQDNYNLDNSMPDTTDPSGAIQTDDHNRTPSAYCGAVGMGVAAVVGGVTKSAPIGTYAGGLAFGFCVNATSQDGTNTGSTGNAMGDSDGLGGGGIGTNG